MTNYGATKAEKVEVGWNLLTVLLGSAAMGIAGVATFVENGWMIFVFIPATFITIASVVLVFLQIEQISLRIRLEESRSKSELIDSILEVYRS